ncbi:mirror-image polydactyly gene 1 protein isoform X2, partial [Scomber scombrus]
AASPRVNTELRQRLPPPVRQQLINPDRSSLSPEHTDRPQAPQHLLQPPPSSCSIRRSASPASPAPPASPASPAPPAPPAASRPPGVGPMEPVLSPSRGSSPQAETCTVGPDGSPASRIHLLTEHSYLEEVSLGVRPPEGNRNVSLLLKELDSLREINKKLCDQLIHKEEELQRKEVEEQLREEQREAQDWERPTAVLEEVLATQKHRDQALMSRLLLANEERDEALLRARRLQQAAELENTSLEDSDMEVDDLLRCVCDADSVQEVQHFGSVLVQRVRLARQRRNDITAQEMKAVMEEREGSVAKFKRLEQEVMQETERPLKEELRRLQNQRDAALEERSRLEAELQMLRANHSSQAPPTQAPPPLSVEAELRRCQEAEREASERVRRLERLVEVLRKKVGTGNVRSVI